MKNQNFGDVVDFGKYGLLRFFAGQGVKIGVNWYLSADDGIRQEKKVAYLEKNLVRGFDEVVFDFLRQTVRENRCYVGAVEEAELIEGAIFYSERLMRENRELWHAGALEQLKGAEMIFLDAESGMPNEKIGTKDATNYIIPSEVVSYYKRGQKRSYIFVIHPEHYKRYMEFIYKFQYTRWHKVFREDFIGGKDPASEEVGTPFVLPLSTGAEMTMKLQQDGRVRIQFSDTQTMSITMSVDQFASYFRR